MKIQSARVIVTCPGRNFVTLKIETDQGVYGIGDATLNGRELSVVSYLEDHVIPCLIGMDPRRIEDIWQYLYRGAYWRRGPVTMRAIAAVDMALWDIKAKMAGMPLYQLLGGRSRDGVMVYGHANGGDIAETVDAVGQYIDMGYKAIRAQTGVPGHQGRLRRRPRQAVLRTGRRRAASVTGWDTRKALNHVPKLFEKLRETYGFDHHLLHDGHHRYTPQEAANLGKMLEPYQLFWLEDCTPAENQEAFKLIRQHTETPLAVGEIFNTIWDAKDLIQNQLIDYIRCTIVGAGGHHAPAPDRRPRRALPDPHRLPRRDRPVARDDGRALHFDTWVPNFGIQEYMRHTRETDAVFPHDYRFEEGYLFAAKRRATASTSTRRWPPNIPTSPPICRSRGSRTGRCGTGEMLLRRSGGGDALRRRPSPARFPNPPRSGDDIFRAPPGREQAVRAEKSFPSPPPPRRPYGAAQQADRRSDGRCAGRRSMQRSPFRATGQRCAALLMPRERFEPALRNLLAAVHRDLDQPMVQRRVGEAVEQRVGIGGEVLPRRGVDRRRGLVAHQPFDDRPDRRDRRPPDGQRCARAPSPR